MKNEVPVNFCRRWRPDFRYVDDKMADVPLKDWKQIEPSVTDKEAYRVTLATLRGQLASGSGSPTVGSYSLKPGEEYNPQTDFSFLNRPDLTIVELDERLEYMRRNLESYDESLIAQAKAELSQAEQRRQKLAKGENETDKGDDK